MKKVFALLLIISVILMSVGCGGKDSKPSNAEAPQGTVEKPKDEAPKETASVQKNLKAVEITPEIPNEYYSYSEDMGLFFYNNYYGYLDSNGKIAVQAIYRHATIFSDGFALVETKDNKLAIIDKQGKEVFKSDKYKFMGTTTGFHNGGAFVGTREGNNYVFIDKTGKELLSRKMEGYAPAGDLGSGIIVWSVINGSKIQLTDASGKIVVNEIATGYGSNNIPNLTFNDDLLSLPNFDKTWNVIDKSGQKQLKEDYQELKQPSEGMIPFMKNEKWGYLDYKGNVAIEPQYEDAFNFHSGLAAVKLNGKIGFIDAKNKMVIEPKFQPSTSVYNMDTTYFNRFDSNGIALVYDNYGSVIDMKGNILISAENVTNVIYNGNGIICFYNNGQSKLYKVVGE